MSADANVWRPPAAPKALRATGRGAASRISRAAEGQGTAGDDPASRYRRARNGLDVSSSGTPSWKRHRKYIIMAAAFSVVYAVLAYLTYRQMGQSLIDEIEIVTREATGSATLVTWAQLNEALRITAAWASLTLLAFLVVFTLLDRLRPTTWTMKFIAFGWGASVAVFVSMHVNTWAGQLMQTEGAVDASQGARAAVFSAPFVEEAAKASVLFLLAILLRRRIVAVHQAVVLSVMSAAGFAFSENIVYYLRTFMYASTIYQVDPFEELHSIVLLRGLATAFGHPMFTSLIGVGLIVGLTHRSKIVRVLAPVTGYMAGAGGHMLFNGLASLNASTESMVIGGWAVVVIFLVFLSFRFVHQVRNIRARLNEFVQMGWLEPDDPWIFTRFFGRWRMALRGLTRGRVAFRDTLRLQRCMTELAYTRDAELRGLIDAMAIEKERELILAIEEARVNGVSRVQGVPVIPPEWGQRFRRWRANLPWNRRRAAHRAALPQPYAPNHTIRQPAPVGR